MVENTVCGQPNLRQGTVITIEYTYPKLNRFVSVLALCASTWLCVVSAGVLAEPLSDEGGGSPPTVPVSVLAQFPHDPRAFTQGLTIADGVLYEGTGWYGESSLRRDDLSSGSVLEQVPLPNNVFGEGIAVVGDRIVQLTWQTHLGYIYDRASFAQIGTFGYPTEGWGITFDGSRVIMSDGSATLRFLDPSTLSEVGTLDVRANGQPVQMLNELEYVNGAILANVWQTDQIAIIDPITGDVGTWLDLTGLNSAPVTSRDDVLNGIAYDADSQRLFVTGKRWPRIYEIEIPQAILPRQVNESAP